MAETGQQPWNVIVLCADEMRGDCLGVDGNPDVKTPHLDAFALRATHCRQHFTPFPKCVPARIAMMTGRYPHTDGFRTITQHLPVDHPNLLKALQERGYQSALFGKNHCWEEFFEGKAVDLHSWSRPVYHDIYDRHRDAPAPPADPQGRPEKDFGGELGYRGRDNAHRGDDAYAEQAIHYLKEGRDRSKPFFMQLNIEAPHPKYGVEDPWFSMYDPAKIKAFPHDLPQNASLPFRAQREIRTGALATEENLREIQATYYGMISKVDHLLGQILQAIEEEGLWENSIICYFSDHGDFAGQYGLHEKWDTVFSDCLTRIPFILHAPGLPGGRVIDGLTELTDYLPTVLELLGIDPWPGIHGESLLPIFAGERRKEAVFAEGGHEAPMLERFAMQLIQQWRGDGPRKDKQEAYAEVPASMARARMVRNERYKLVIRLQGGNELYDLEEDPAELHNRWGDPALDHVQRQLQQQLIEFSLRTDTDRPYQEAFGA